MSKTINNGKGVDTLENGLARLRSFAIGQVLVSIFMIALSFIVVIISSMMMMLSSEIGLVSGVVIIISLGIILSLLYASENLSEAIDSFKKIFGESWQKFGEDV